MIRLIAGAVIGFALGCGTTYIMINKKYNDRLNADIEKLSAHKKEKNKEETKKEPEPIVKKAVKKPEVDVQQSKNQSDTVNKARVAYTDYYTVKGTTYEDDSKEEEPKDNPNATDEYQIITEDQFDEDIDYDKQFLKYYKDELLLTDGHYELDPEETIGGWNMRHMVFRKDSNGNRTCHIRNNATKTDYEVELDLGPMPEVIRKDED